MGLTAGRDALGPVGAVLIWTIGLAFAVTLTLLALGLSASEWRAAGRSARGAARLVRRLRDRRAVPTVRLPRWLGFRRTPGAVVRREPAPVRLEHAVAAEAATGRGAHHAARRRRRAGRSRRACRCMRPAGGSRPCRC